MELVGTRIELVHLYGYKRLGYTEPFTNKFASGKQNLHLSDIQQSDFFPDLVAVFGRWLGDERPDCVWD